MSKTVVRLDNIEGAKPISIKYHNGTNYAAIENGSVVALDGLVADEREVFKVIAIADADAAGATIASGNIAFVASPEYMTDPTKKNLDEFENPANVAARGYLLEKGNIVSLTSEGFASVPTSTNYIVTFAADDSLKLTGVATAVNNKVGEFIGSDTVGSKTFYAIRICD